MKKCDSKVLSLSCCFVLSISSSSDFEEFLLPTIIRMSGWLGIKHNTLECWLILQNVPTKADFFVVALRTHPKLRIFFNHHIEESFDFVFSLEKEAFKKWLEESFLQKLVRGGLITFDDVATLIDKV